jgi:hypothetical protein
MDELFPLKDVIFCQQASTSRVKAPLLSSASWQVSRNEFAMQMEGVGDFYARDGRYVEFAPLEGSDPEWVRLCLNGRVLVALLHQRRIISFHGSSFINNGSGIMITGETGSGKSSLTASFALNGDGFLTDDLTPVIFRKSHPYIRPFNGAIKLSDDSIKQLNIGSHRLTRAETGTGKHYLYPFQSSPEDFPLHIIFKIEIAGINAPEFHLPSPAERFSLLRSEICAWEMLAGMPETEADYLHQLLQIVRQVKFVRVVRPFEIEIQKLHKAMADYLKTGD